MKIDLLKMLRENPLYQEGLKGIPEADRDRAQKNVESLMSELVQGFEQFAAKITGANEETKDQIRQAINDDSDLVIDEIQASSGSVG